MSFQGSIQLILLQINLESLFGLVNIILETVKSVHHNILEPTVA